MHAQDLFPQLTVGPVLLQDIRDPLCLGPQPGLGVHQVAGVQHDPRPGVLDPGDQVLRLRRVQEGEARPPLVFHQEIKGGLHTPEQLVDELDGSVQHFPVGVAPAVGEPLLQRHIGYVKHRVGRVHGHGKGQILFELGHQLLRPGALVDPPDHLPGAEFAHERLLVLPVEVQPVGVKHQMIPRQQGRREGPVQVHRVHDALHAVAAQGMDGIGQPLPAAVGGDAVSAQGEIDTLDHGVTLFLNGGA